MPRKEMLGSILPVSSLEPEGSISGHNLSSIHRIIDKISTDNDLIRASMDEMRQSEQQRDEALRSFIQEQFANLKASMSSLVATSSVEQSTKTSSVEQSSNSVAISSIAEDVDSEEDVASKDGCNEFFEEQNMQAQGPHEEACPDLSPKDVGLGQDMHVKTEHHIPKLTKALTLSQDDKFGDKFGHKMHATKGDHFQMFAQSLAFQVSVVVMIIVQAIVLGWEAQIDMQLEIDRLEGRIKERPSHFNAIGWFFNIFFGMELLVRLLAWRQRFFDWKSDQEFFVWNMFDTMMFLGMFLEFGDVQIDVLRAARLLRIARVLRIIRVFAKLRKMIYALLHSMQSLLWLLILLFTTLYIFALVFMQGANRYLQTLDSSNYESEIQFGESHGTYIVVNRFGTLFLTMRSLFATITGGDPWDWLFEPIMESSWMYSISAIFFILFFIFAVMNVVTGVFVDEAMKISQIDKEIAISDKISEEKALVKDIKQFVAGVDKDGDGSVDIQELTDMLESEQVMRWLTGLDLDICAENIDQIIRLLDTDHKGKIDPDKFVDSLVKLRGNARSTDLLLLANDIKLGQQMLREFLEDERRNHMNWIKKQHAGNLKRERKLDSIHEKMLAVHEKAKANQE